MYDFDVFISYSHKDAHIADAVCHKFEEAGLRCWYAPRNIEPGDVWADAIIRALERCRLMILIFTDYSNASTQVRREVDTAVSAGKTIIPFRCSDTAPSGSMRYYLSTLHWMDAVDKDMDSSIGELLELAKRILTNKDSNGVSSGSDSPISNGAGKVTSSVTGRESFMAGAAASPSDSAPTPKTEAASDASPESASTALPESTHFSSVSAKSSAGINDSTTAQKRAIKPAYIAALAALIVLLAIVIPLANRSGGKDDSSAGTSKQAAEQTSEQSSDQSGGDSSLASSDQMSTESSGAEDVSYELNEDDDSPGAENYLYTVLPSNTGIRLDKYFGEGETKVTLPEKIDGIPVIETGDKCFQDNETITEVLFPDKFQSAGYRSFYGCKNLTKINFPEGMTRIGSWAFAHTGFESIEIPDTVTVMADGAFHACSNLKTVVLPDTIKSIERDTFGWCGKLESVTIPAEDVTIDSEAFDDDAKLTLIGAAGSYTEKYAKGMGFSFKKY